VGPAGAPLEEHAVRCGRTDGHGHPHTHAVHRGRFGARRQRTDGQEPDAGSRTDLHDDVHRHEVDRQEVDGPQVHEACGRREEGGHGPQVHRQEVNGSQVHQARCCREEGSRHEEAEDRHGSQVHGSQVHGSQVHGSQVHGSQVHQARGRRQEGGSDEEAENGGGSPCPRSEHALRDVEDGSGADAVGDSPGEPFEIPDTPVAVEESGTTAEEQRERSLERRLAMDDPDASPTDPPAAEGARPHPILDDDVATEDAVAEDSDGPADEADLDRTREEVGELSSDPAESAEESAMHIERE
jgi:hypothetical protein